MPWYDQDYLLEQYKLLWDSFNGELQRFWLRYNILLGLELAAVYLVTKNYTELSARPVFLGTILLLASVYGIVICAIVSRAIVVYRLLGDVLSKIEEASDFRVSLFRALDLAADTRNQPPISAPVSMYLAQTIVVVLAAAWTLAFFYQLEVSLWSGTTP